MCGIFTSISWVMASHPMRRKFHFLQENICEYDGIHFILCPTLSQNKNLFVNMNTFYIVSYIVTKQQFICEYNGIFLILWPTLSQNKNLLPSSLTDDKKRLCYDDLRLNFFLSVYSFLFFFVDFLSLPSTLISIFICLFSDQI